MEQKKNPSKPVDTRLGIIGNDILKRTRANFDSIPKHSADVFFPEQKIIVNTQKKRKKK